MPTLIVSSSILKACVPCICCLFFFCFSTHDNRGRQFRSPLSPTTTQHLHTQNLRRARPLEKKLNLRPWPSSTTSIMPRISRITGLLASADVALAVASHQNSPRFLASSVTQSDSVFNSASHDPTFVSKMVGAQGTPCTQFGPDSLPVCWCFENDGHDIGVERVDITNAVNRACEDFATHTWGFGEGYTQRLMRSQEYELPEGLGTAKYPIDVELKMALNSDDKCEGPYHFTASECSHYFRYPIDGW